MTFIRTALAAALALAAAPAAAQTYSQTIFFGDSLTDAGHFRPVLVQQAGPQAAILGRFTTNPGLIWAEYVADFYGTRSVSANQGGTNYAVGGARVGVNTSGALGPIPAVTTQVNSYLTANGGRADANALYTVWGGANDLFAVAGGAPAAATIGGAVTAQVGAIAALQSAGARYVLVPTIPDLGLTPSGRAQGPAAQAQLTQIATAYNNALYSGLASAGLRVIPLDMFNLFREVSANPAAFGIGNVTGTACQPQITAQSLTCNPTTLIAPNAATNYAFADGVHPSSAGHEIVGDYALSMLEAPRQIAVLPNSASAVGRARAERVAMRTVGQPAGEGTQWWADVRGDMQRYGHGDHYDGAGPALLGGVDFNAGNAVFGAFAGYGRNALDWGMRGGSFDQTDATIGGHAGWRSGGGWASAQVSYSRIGFDVERNVDLGRSSRTHRGSADGTNLSAGVQGGWEFGSGALRHGPVVGVLSQRIEIDGFAEDQAALSTSLAYPEQRFDSLIGSVGWQLSVQAYDVLAPYARLTVDREFEDRPAEAFARSQSLVGSGEYAVPGVAFDQRYGTLTVGARTRVFGVPANVGAMFTVGQAGGANSTLFASFNGSF